MGSARRAGELVSRAWGAVSGEARPQMAAQAAWLLSRLRPRVAVEAAAATAADAGALGAYGPPTGALQTGRDRAVSRGPRWLPGRLLAYGLPAEVGAQRRRTAPETARKKGRPPPQA